MYPGVYAQVCPDRPAIIMGHSGEVVTFAELDRRSNQLAQLWRSRGLKRGDHVAAFLENHVRYTEVTWAALRAGLFITPVNSHLTGEEAAYIIADCGAQGLVTSRSLADAAADAMNRVGGAIPTKLMLDGAIDGFDPYEQTVAAFPTTQIDDESYGAPMFYSSGTTGRPKGILRPLPDAALADRDQYSTGMAARYRMHDGLVYLSPAPTYHAAPFTYSYMVQRNGGTVVSMERFDPLEALALIERYRVTHSQWVPTMFQRMLRLSDEDRQRFDLSSLAVAIHAAAPCPIAVKRQMIEWWGPILEEYYAASEGHGSTAITSVEWLARPGSVGRASSGTIRIMNDDGEELPPGTEGTIYFDGGGVFEYHNDPEKTKTTMLRPGLRTVGDIGYLDGEGWLFLTDRKADMIISGGVNIYPREAEDVLSGHRAVFDVAVFGIPNEEFGEEVRAVVQLADGFSPSDSLAAELIAYTKTHLAAFKCPRSLDFSEQLPRLATGKLYKRLLRDPYWKDRATRIS